MKKAKSLSPEALVKLLKELLPEPERAGQVLLDAFQKQKLSPVLLLHGPHPLRIRRTIQWIKDSYFQKAGTASSYFGSDLTSKAQVEPIINSLRNVSLFSPLELIVIHNADKIRAAAAKPLLEALEGTLQSAWIICAVDGELPKTGFAADLSASALSVKFEDFSESDAKRWIEREAIRNGSAGIAPDAAALLLRCHGTDTEALEQQVQKLCLLTERGSKISRKLVEQISLKNPETTSFELIRAMSRKNALAAVGQTKQLLEQGMHPLQVSSFLSKVFRAYAAQVGDVPASERAGELNNPWFLKNLSSSGKQYTDSDLRRSIQLLAKLDFALKDSAMEHSFALELAVHNITSRSFPRSLEPR